MFQPIYHSSLLYQGRCQMICRNALLFRCNNQNCRWFHFKLPVVRISFLVFRQFLNSFCRMKKSSLLNENRSPSLPSRRPATPPIPTEIGQISNLYPQPTNLCLPPHHLRMGGTLTFIGLNAPRGMMVVVPKAGTARCSIFTG